MTTAQREEAKARLIAAMMCKRGVLRELFA